MRLPFNIENAFEYKLDGIVSSKEEFYSILEESKLVKWLTKNIGPLEPLKDTHYISGKGWTIQNSAFTDPLCNQWYDYVETDGIIDTKLITHFYLLFN